MFGHLGKINQLIVADVFETMAVTHRTIVNLSGVEDFLGVVVAELGVTLNYKDNLAVLFVTVETARSSRLETAEHNLVILILEVTSVQQTFAALESFNVL